MTDAVDARRSASRAATKFIADARPSRRRSLFDDDDDEATRLANVDGIARWRGARADRRADRATSGRARSTSATIPSISDIDWDID